MLYCSSSNVPSMAEENLDHQHKGQSSLGGDNLEHHNITTQKHS